MSSAREKVLSLVDEKLTEERLLRLKTANQTIIDARAMPEPKKLFGQLWCEGEICFLFASSNVGKSILAVQIADSITKGRMIYPLEMEAAPQPLLYFDFELSEKQFQNRYTNEFDTPYLFSDNFYRVDIDHNAEFTDRDSFEEQLNKHLEAAIKEKEAKILIVDNITFLKGDTEKSKDAVPFMRALKRLKSKYQLSILVLGHTPKRDASKHLTINDLAGSAHLGNFIDSAFAIGVSTRGKGQRYIKQIKVRNFELNFGFENVMLFEIQKDANFLKFHFLEYSDEDTHLASSSAMFKEDQKARAIEMKLAGKSLRTIRDELGVPKSTIGDWLKDMDTKEPENDNQDDVSF